MFLKLAKKLAGMKGAKMSGCIFLFLLQFTDNLQFYRWADVLQNPAEL